MLLKVSRISQDSNCVGVSVWINCRAEGLQLYQKETPAQVISSEICLSFKNTFFYRTSPVAASGHSSSFLEAKAFKKVFGNRANVFINISHCFYACWNYFLVTAEGIFDNPDFLKYIRLSILRAPDITNISILRTEVHFPLFCSHESLINHFCITNIRIANSRFYKPKKPRYKELKALNTGKAKKKTFCIIFF